jgi:general secretion pathway protein G
MYFYDDKGNKDKNGFTLVEVLLITAILSLVMSILISSTQDARKQARDATRESDIRNIQASMAVFFDQNDRYPSNYSELLNSNLFNQIPQDPSTGSEYPYATSTAGDNFDLCVAACMELPENGGGESGICEDGFVSYSANESYIKSNCSESNEYYIGI